MGGLYLLPGIPVLLAAGSPSGLPAWERVLPAMRSILRPSRPSSIALALIALSRASSAMCATAHNLHMKSPWPQPAGRAASRSAAARRCCLRRAARDLHHERPWHGQRTRGGMRGRTPSMSSWCLRLTKSMRKRLQPRRFREEDPLGGTEPYALSKASAEFAVEAYRHSRRMRDRRGLALATVRAGNIIGGGDWARERLIPDAVRAFHSGRPLLLRKPDAVRPWQFVLDRRPRSASIGRSGLPRAGRLFSILEFRTDRASDDDRCRNCRHAHAPLGSAGYLASSGDARHSRNHAARDRQLQSHRTTGLATAMAARKELATNGSLVSAVLRRREGYD